MKATRLIFLAIGCGLFMLGTSRATASNPAPQQASSQVPASTASERSTDAGRTAPTGEAEPGKQRISRPGSNVSNAHMGTSVANAKHPKHFPSGPERPASGNAGSLIQPSPSRSAAGVKNGPSKDKTVSTSAIRPSSFLSSTSSLDNVRHRGPNPAAIGGPANSKTWNTVALNGTHMNRRP
jgi:hypothetical protein